MLRTGIDLIEIDRVARVLARHGDHFLQRVYTPQEIAYCAGRASSLAARFAAKEAVAKALGTGIGPVAWKEIEVQRAPGGRPVVALHGAARRIADALGLADWSLSLTHSRDLAVAFVVAQPAAPGASAGQVRPPKA
jgi:holo-[acyl-carrier protein] synthase